ncbi:MAG: hypothetical protein ABGW81_03835 [Paracoccaceae bacterium]
MVLTTAGYISQDAETIARIRRFMRGVEDVIYFFGQKEGLTVSLWENDGSMMKLAYW